MGNGNYLGQDFYAVQPCPKCGGKGFLNPDGSMNNDFQGSDGDPVIGCPACVPAEHKSWCLIDKPGCGPVHCTCWREQ